MRIDREQLYRVVLMAESGLVSRSALVDWADRSIGAALEPPAWLCEVAVQQTDEGVVEVLRSVVFAEPFEVHHSKRDDRYFFACLFERAQLGECRWAEFLDTAGRHADSADLPSDRAYFFELLNEFEGAGETLEVMRVQSRSVAARLENSLTLLRQDLEALGFRLMSPGRT